MQEADTGGLLHLRVIWRKEPAGEAGGVKGFVVVVCVSACTRVRMCM